MALTRCLMILSLLLLLLNSGCALLRKPEKEIYEIAMQRANANPQECLFIDDLLENIQAAKQIGIEGIHFLSSEQLKQELVHLGIINEY